MFYLRPVIDLRFVADLENLSELSFLLLEDAAISDSGVYRCTVNWPGASLTTQDLTLTVVDMGEGEGECEKVPPSCHAGPRAPNPARVTGCRLVAS